MGKVMKWATGLVTRGLECLVHLVAIQVISLANIFVEGGNSNWFVKSYRLLHHVNLLFSLLGVDPSGACFQ